MMFIIEGCPLISPNPAAFTDILSGLAVAPAGQALAIQDAFHSPDRKVGVCLASTQIRKNSIPSSLYHPITAYHVLSFTEG